MFSHNQLRSVQSCINFKETSEDSIIKQIQNNNFYFLCKDGKLRKFYLKKKYHKTEKMNLQSIQKKHFFQAEKQNFKFENNIQTRQSKLFQKIKNIKKICKHSKCKIIGGGCSSSKLTFNPQQISINEKKSMLDEKFINKYNYFTDKKKLVENIEQESQERMQVEIIKYLKDNDPDIRNDIIIYKPKLMQLIETYLIYSLTRQSEKEVHVQNQIKEIGPFIKELKESFDSISQEQPTCDLTSYFDILYRVNSNRVGMEDQNKSQLIKSVEFITTIVKLGAGTSETVRGNFMKEIDLALQGVQYLLKSLQFSKTHQIFSYLLDIWVKKVVQFQDRIWVLTFLEELEFHIGIFNELCKKNDDDTDLVLLTLIKIDQYFCLALEDENSKKVLSEKLSLNCELIKFFIPMLIQKSNSKSIFDGIQSFLKFTVINHTYRFLTISVLLKYNKIISGKIDISGYKEKILVYLCYKYISEKNKSVKLAFETSKEFAEYFNQRIQQEKFKVEIIQLSSDRSEDLKQLVDLEGYEEKIKNSQDIDRMIANLLIEKWERDVSKRQKENISQKDDILLEVQDLYIQQQITYLEGNKMIQAPKHSQIKNNYENQQIKRSNALQEILEIFLQGSKTPSKKDINVSDTGEQIKFSDSFSQGSKKPSQEDINISDTEAQLKISDNFLQDSINSSDEDINIFDSQAQMKILDNFLQGRKAPSKEDKNLSDTETQTMCKILGILAEGGTGKSMFIKKLETHLIQIANSKTEQENFIPLLIKCNSLDPESPSIENYLLSQGVSNLQITTIKKSNRNKVILLDGYDEFTGESFRVYQKLNLHEWKNTKVIVSSRREKLELSEACINFSLDGVNGRDNSSFCIVKLEEFTHKDILQYCEIYFKQYRTKENQFDQLIIQNDMDVMIDCMKNRSLEGLLYLPINLYLFTRMIVSIKDKTEIQKIKESISDQIGIQEIFFHEQFKREAQEFVQIQIKEPDRRNNDMSKLIISSFFEYFQSISMKMFLNKGKPEIANFLQIQKDKIQFKLSNQIEKQFSEKEKKGLHDKITNYVNSKIITRSKEEISTNQENKILNKRYFIEFRHKTLFEYFAARAMKYDFDLHGDDIYKLTIEQLKEFNINKKSIMIGGQNQSEQQILIKLYRMIKNEIESEEFYSNYFHQEIEKNSRYIQYIKKSRINKYTETSQIDIGASNILSALFLSKFAFSNLKLRLCSISKLYASQLKSDSINFDCCNLQYAYLENIRNLNYDSCNTKFSTFDAYQQMFDTQNIYTFSKVIWDKMNKIYTINKSGFINVFQIENQNILHLCSKQISKTRLIQIIKFNSDTLLVSSQYTLLLINCNTFEILESYKFNNEISSITLIKENILVTFLNKSLFHGSFKAGFRQMSLISSGCIYNEQFEILLLLQNQYISIYDTKENFKFIKRIEEKKFSNETQYPAFSPDGKYFLINFSWSYKIWNVEKDFELINTIQAHSGSINSIVFSPDGKYLVTAAEDKTCKIWDTEKNFELINTVKGLSYSINFVAFSEEGKYLATISRSIIFKIWNADQEFELFNTIQGHQAIIFDVTFSANGKYLATCSADTTCRIWNAEKGFELINTIQHNDYVISAAFSSDGKYFATGSKDLTCKIWNAEKNFELINTLNGHTNSITSVSFTYDGKYLASGSADMTCKIWNVERGFELIETIKGHTGSINSVAFSVDGRYLATGSQDNTCIIWDVEKDFEAIDKLRDHTDPIKSIAFSADGKYLATGSEDKTCKIWNVEKGFEILQTIQAHTKPIHSIAFSSDGKSLATSSGSDIAVRGDNCCKIWNAEKGFELINTILHNDGEQIFSVDFSTDGKYLATSSDDRACKIWNAGKGIDHIKTVSCHNDAIYCVAFSADEKYLATGSCDKTCKIWSLKRGFELIKIIQGTSYVTSVAFSADGKYFVSRFDDKTCKIWDAEKEFEFIQIIQGDNVAFSADGKYMATLSDMTFRIWNAKKGFELINQIQGHTSGIHCIIFSQDGKYLATSSKDKTCKIWNIEKGFELINTIQDQTSRHHTIAFSANRKYLATISKDNACNIWNVQKDFEFIKKVKVNNLSTDFVAFSADGKYLATTSSKTCRIWNADQGFELIYTIQGHIDQVTSLSFSPNGKYLATASSGNDKTCKIWNAQKKFDPINPILNHMSGEESYAITADGQYVSVTDKDSNHKIHNLNDFNWLSEQMWKNYEQLNENNQFEKMRLFENMYIL